MCRAPQQGGVQCPQVTPPRKGSVEGTANPSEAATGDVCVDFLGATRSADARRHWAPCFAGLRRASTQPAHEQRGSGSDEGISIRAGPENENAWLGRIGDPERVATCPSPSSCLPERERHVWRTARAGGNIATVGGPQGARRRRTNPPTRRPSACAPPSRVEGDQSVVLHITNERSGRT